MVAGRDVAAAGLRVADNEVAVRLGVVVDELMGLASLGVRRPVGFVGESASGLATVVRPGLGVTIVFLVVTVTAGVNG